MFELCAVAAHIAVLEEGDVGEVRFTDEQARLVFRGILELAV